MSTSLRELLQEAQDHDAVPHVVAYNRIDGPGSSLDLREFQQSLWTLPRLPESLDDDPAAEWSRHLPRTIGFTIDVGTRIEARPFDKGRIQVRSVEYGTEVSGVPGEVPPRKENWLLKILETFGLSGVSFVLHNLRPGVRSSGLGGSATATTGVCILANALAGSPFSPVQLISMASRVEQDLGVSLTGTQEQSNVLFGGVTDYVWFPWGIPGRPDSGFGESLRFELVADDEYPELEARMALIHTGRPRASTDVNSVWRDKLQTQEGFRLHSQKLELAYRFREGLRSRDWKEVVRSIDEYRGVRTQICPDYMEGSTEIQGFAETRQCATFPLGAGGGGTVLVFGQEPEGIRSLKSVLKDVYREIPIRIRKSGYREFNLPLE